MANPVFGGDDAAAAVLTVGGAKIPVLGFGTYGMSGPGLQRVLVAALQQGFRHIDTAPALRASSASFVKIFFPAMRPDSQAPVI
jgi:diketogulonate reductase-like aldo/keto reductase